MSIKDSTIEVAIKELHKGFRLLNERIFHNQLPLPAILVQNQGTRTRNILGWCTVDKIWADEKRTIQMYELNITAEFLNRPLAEVMATMLHEMVHLYCSVADIKDTSRSGGYHNKRFKAEAERFGFEVTFDKKNGWEHTALLPQTLAIIEGLDLDQEAFKIKRYTWGEATEENDEELEEKPKKKPQNIWHCPSCGIEIKPKKKIKLNIICGKCMKPFVEKPDEENQEESA